MNTETEVYSQTVGKEKENAAKVNDRMFVLLSNVVNLLRENCYTDDEIAMELGTTMEVVASLTYCSKSMFEEAVVNEEFEPKGLSA